MKKLTEVKLEKFDRNSKKILEMTFTSNHSIIEIMQNWRQHLSVVHFTTYIPQSISFTLLFPFFSIAAVSAGGQIAGVAAMFLAIPLMALIKVVFDNVNQLKPWGELMGDTLPKTVKWKNLLWPKID